MARRLNRVRNVDLRRLVLGIVALVLVIAASVGGYVASRHATNQSTFFGNFDSRDRVEVTAWITRVDTAAQTLSVTLVDIRPYGALADDDSSNFAVDAEVVTNAVGNWKTPITGGDSAPDIDQRIALNGSVTDYPFDRYRATLELHVVRTDGTELPTAITVLNTDPFFAISATSASAPAGGTVVNLGVRRSAPTLVFAVFIMVLMLGLAAAAAVAAYYVLRGRRGLVFGACSVMAALLFALIPLRNAVPGSPPIGSLIDFASFFIAEAVISISLISCVLIGYRHEMARERADAATTDAGPDTGKL